MFRVFQTSVLIVIFMLDFGVRISVCCCHFILFTYFFACFLLVNPTFSSLITIASTLNIDFGFRWAIHHFTAFQNHFIIVINTYRNSYTSTYSSVTKKQRTIDNNNNKFCMVMVIIEGTKKLGINKLNWNTCGFVSHACLPCKSLMKARILWLFLFPIQNSIIFSHIPQKFAFAWIEKKKAKILHICISKEKITNVFQCYFQSYKRFNNTRNIKKWEKNKIFRSTLKIWIL